MGLRAIRVFTYRSRLSRRLPEWRIFLAAFLAFAWFHQGGGWNQNARFAEVRAMAEQGRFAADDFIVYQHDKQGRLSRTHVENGDYKLDGQRFRLMWNEDGTGPVNGLAPGDSLEPASLNFIACSGDLGFALGHFHPNKPPGTSFAALPGYWLVCRAERLLGVDPDGWWVLTLNAWLASVFSVGLVSALGVVVFFRVAKMFAGGAEKPALLATVAFAFGTLYFPFATLLFDHNLVAAALLASFYFILRDCVASASCRSSELPPRIGRMPMPHLFLSGFCAGFAAITNYVAAVAVVLLGVFLIAKKIREGLPRAFAAVLWLALGALGPFVLICFYNQVCYGSPFALCNDFQNPRFKDITGGFLGMFGAPSLPVALMLLWSQYRGLFFFCPSLLLAAFGVVVLVRKKMLRAEVCLCLAMAALFYWVNLTFNGWPGGYTTGPRYLIPAMPFLALLAAPAFVRFPKTSCAFAAAGIAINFLSAAVDSECPVGTGFLATIESRSDWENKPVPEYTAPLFLTGEAYPLLSAFAKEDMLRREAALREDGLSGQELQNQLGIEWNDLNRASKTGKFGRTDFYLPFLYLATMKGPVSVNPIGSWEGIYYTHFQPRSPQCVWSSFNAGEFLFPESRWSVVPMLAVCGWLLASAFRASSAVQRAGA